MHRVRQSLPYLRDFGWDATVMVVRPELVEGNRDEDLVQTIPTDADIQTVGALNHKWTRLFGLGSLALRSLPFYARRGNQLLALGKYDLVYFSTTMFPVMSLGPYWKRKFGLPYVIDMQDPWHSEYYLSRPKHERPPKHWFSYRLNKWLEPKAMMEVGGLISVSEGYCRLLRDRYPEADLRIAEVIPFGGASRDFEVLDRTTVTNDVFEAGDGDVHVVYVGRGGHDMAQACRGIFGALKQGLADAPDLFGRVRMHFIGTDYAPDGRAKKTIAPIAAEFGVEDQVSESPHRIPYFKVLRLLRDAHMVVIPGSDDPNYTASKVYPYIQSRRPLLAVFSQTSSVVEIVRSTKAGEVVTFMPGHDDDLPGRVYETWRRMLERLPYEPETDWTAFEPYTAREMTRRQVEVFDRVLAKGGS